MKITILHPYNFFNIQGAAEPYYMYHYLKSIWKVYLITGEGKNSNEPDIYHIQKKKSLFPYKIYFDLKSLLKSIKAPFRKTKLFYTYNGIIITPLVMKIIFKKYWVSDLRADPVEQEEEFSTIYGSNNIFRRLYFKIIKHFYRFGFKYCDMVITLSEPLKKSLIKNYSIEGEKISILPLGVDLKTFKPSLDIFNTENFNAKMPCLIYVTSLGLQRGFFMVFTALRILKEKGLTCRLVIAGSGPEKITAELKENAARENVHELIEWKGLVPHKEIPALLDKCDIALCPLPNLQAYRVASPTKVFEYLAMKKIVITTNLPSNNSIIINNYNGLLIPPEDSSALANAILEIIRNESLRNTLKDNSRKSVQKYDWPVMLSAAAEKILTIVKEGERRCH